MKKLMIMAAAVLLAVSAMAQNPDALKQIKKCKTAAEAEALIKQNESTMTAAENAQAYNKLVDLYMVPIKKVDDDMVAAQMAGKQPEYDKAAYAADIMAACKAALTCYKYDMQPNEKGKVSPKFSKANASRLYNYRIHMIIAGQDYLQAGKYEESAPLFFCYSETGYSPMFAEVKALQEKAGQKDEYLSQCLDTAARLYTQIKKYDEAAQCGDILCQDPKTLDFGLTVKLNAYQASAKTHEDSVKVLNQFKEAYAKYPDSPVPFTYLAQALESMNMKAEQDQLVDAFIAKHPEVMTAHLFKAQSAMTAQKYDDAIASYKKAVECKTEDPLQKGYAYTYMGYCYFQKAAALNTKAEQKPLIEEAAKALEEARKADPNHERANWPYFLYQCYYALYGDADARTKEVAAIAGM